MSARIPEYTITYGGWYQRTTLHLSEIYDLLALGRTSLPLDPARLRQFHSSFGFTTVFRENGAFEYILATTKNGIELRYYEDGLYVLTCHDIDISSGRKLLEKYYENVLSPALAFIFSLGAPTPKVLAAIHTSHPTVVSITTPQHTSLLKSNRLGEIYSTYSSDKLIVHKTPSYIIISSPASYRHSRELIEMQIFFREFKDQLQRYLNLHRSIWEEISDIKERGAIRGNEVEDLRHRLDSHQKTINLIKSRINQMGSYVRTRASIARSLDLESHLNNIFQYKFETLIDTHSYIQEIWKMTSDYVDSAIQVINEVRSKTTTNSLNSLRLITTIGVLSGIFGYLSRDAFPAFTLIGLWYFIVLLLGTALINQVIVYIYQHLQYKLKFTDNSASKM